MLRSFFDANMLEKTFPYCPFFKISFSISLAESQPMAKEAQAANVSESVSSLTRFNTSSGSCHLDSKN